MRPCTGVRVLVKREFGGATRHRTTAPDMTKVPASSVVGFCSSKHAGCRQRYQVRPLFFESLWFCSPTCRIKTSVSVPCSVESGQISCRRKRLFPKQKAVGSTSTWRVFSLVSPIFVTHFTTTVKSRRNEGTGHTRQCLTGSFRACLVRKNFHAL